MLDTGGASVRNVSKVGISGLKTTGGGPVTDDSSGISMLDTGGGGGGGGSLSPMTSMTDDGISIKFKVDRC